MAKKVTKVITYSSRNESMLSTFAAISMFLGIVALVACVVVSGYWTKQTPYDDWGEHGLSWFWLVGGVGAFFEGLVAFVVLSAIADTLRIVKKIAGIPYGGTIGGRKVEFESLETEE